MGGLGTAATNVHPLAPREAGLHKESVAVATRREHRARDRPDGRTPVRSCVAKSRHTRTKDVDVAVPSDHLGTTRGS